MSIKLASKLIISIAILFAAKTSLASLYPLKQGGYIDVVVGSGNNGVATVSISNSDIQQSILSTISDLSGTTITNSQSFISVGTVSYLIFQVITSESDTMSIAIALSVAGNQYLFQPHTSKEVHMCKGYGSCTSCTFMFGESNTIQGCSIKKIKRGEKLNNAGCNLL